MPFAQLNFLSIAHKILPRDTFLCHFKGDLTKKQKQNSECFGTLERGGNQRNALDVHKKHMTFLAAHIKRVSLDKVQMFRCCTTTPRHAALPACMRTTPHFYASISINFCQ